MKKRLNLIIVCLCVLLAALVLMFFIFLAEREIFPKEEIKVDTVRTDNYTLSEGERVNVLILGKDSTSGLTDVIILASYDEAEKSANIVQLPRDTYAEFSQKNYKKLNGAAYSLGGERELCDFISESFCIDVDYYISLDLSALGEIVDTIGGVEVNIPFDMNYDDPVQGLSIHLKQGKNVLDGRAARQFVRYRAGYMQGDLGRIDAQKIFLAALVNKMKDDVSVLNGVEIAVKSLDDVSTDIPLHKLIWLAREAFDVSSDKIRFITLAGEGAIAKKSGASYYVISRPSAIEIVNKYLGGNADEKSFDKDRAFLNEGYDEFKRIYNSYIEYWAYDAESISENGIEIARK